MAEKGEGSGMTYGSLIRQCLLEEAERLKPSPALAEEITRNVLQVLDSRTASPLTQMGEGKN